jgi:thioredoxin-like negative regulator of GroEL
MMMGMGQYRQALRILNAARRFRQHPAILFNMAICFEHIGAYRRAAAIYQRVSTDPTVGAQARERVAVLMNVQGGFR